MRHDMHHVSNISIHALRKESDQDGARQAIGLKISIHALRKESDQRRVHSGRTDSISIHALRKESDRHVCPHFAHILHFNPRSP